MYIEKLVLAWDWRACDIIQDGDIIDNLRPHTNLKRLSVNLFGGSRFPTWVANPLFSNLQTLKLWKCKNCLSIPQLGQLPSLEHLRISGMNRIERDGSEFYHYGNASSSISVKPSFPSLQNIWVDGQLEEMVVLWMQTWRIPSSPGALYAALSQTHWEITKTASILEETWNCWMSAAACAFTQSPCNQ